jgi:hypothetical protein
VARSGVVLRCLVGVERCNLADLILPTDRAAAQLAATRAALSLLLRLAQLPGGTARSFHSSTSHLNLSRSVTELVQRAPQRVPLLS